MGCPIATGHTVIIRHDRGLCGLPIHQQHALKAGVAQLYRLGPRVACEIILELVQRRGDLTDLLVMLDRLQGWTPALVEAVGADQFPPRPLRQAA